MRSRAMGPAVEKPWPERQNGPPIGDPFQTKESMLQLEKLGK